MDDKLRTDDITPEVRAHMDRADRWYKEHPGAATPREWYEPSVPSPAERTHRDDRADWRDHNLTDEELARQVKEREQEQARSLVRPARTPRSTR